MKLIVNMLLLLAAVVNVALAQKQELRWGEFGYYSNWNRHSYVVASEYQFFHRLPDLREFPKLLEAALDPKKDHGDRVLITSQMRTLSRCDFEKSPKAGGDVEVEYYAAVSRWKDWWLSYGSKLPVLLDENGKRPEKAWKQIAPSPHLEIPKYPISIPQSWSSTLSFRSGDYAGITEEVIEFRVADENCSLRRRYRTGAMGKESWTQEEWQGFSHEEAEHFLASLIYLIDNPWFYANDELSEVEEEKKEIKMGHIRGRPRAWSNYYPGYEWTGILDAEQRVIINHDPSNWQTIDYDLGPKTSLDDAAFGIVFRLVRDSFPDPSWNPTSSKWKRTEITPKKKGE